MKLLRTFIFGASILSIQSYSRIFAKMSSTCPATASYEKNSSSIAYVTMPNNDAAKALAHKIVGHKLAACVNVIPGITSIYSWEGKIDEDNEVLMMIKTRTSRVQDLIKFVKESHPYSVAEVI
uniref:CutA1 divalent ion tolerance protein n=1 Tax=Megaselia scalaris TaxID=36166 RepID=T1GD97_MEGSC